MVRLECLLTVHLCVCAQQQVFSFHHRGRIWLDRPRQNDCAVYTDLEVFCPFAFEWWAVVSSRLVSSRLFFCRGFFFPRFNIPSRLASHTMVL